jgi:hypothetical protein
MYYPLHTHTHAGQAQTVAAWITRAANALGITATVKNSVDDDPVCNC